MPIRYTLGKKDHGHIPLTIDSKKIKHVEMNLIKQVKGLYNEDFEGGYSENILENKKIIYAQGLAELLLW